MSGTSVGGGPTKLWARSSRLRHRPGVRGRGGAPKGEPQMLKLIQTKALMALAGLRDREEGQALVEYALILSLIAVLAIGALTLVGENVTHILSQIGRAL